ncbi:MAG: hypothetical protein BEU01_00320 [Marine Group III euryarchaeote CG-Epi4]|uniref:Uncharacterized protein n=1 Tax=Marine Group III euryarchaeote CG-Epi4 TaxID=1888998 RepID=A0A1J5UBT2_9ARCH|nr:MAG: hypothetical protein BEU01_00320 [Marine Group III euryarchaeote CG-Epi4]
MISNNEKNLGLLFLSILDSKPTIEECISKSGLTADNISTIISIPKYDKYFVKNTDKELRISCKTDWISEDMAKNIKISKSEVKILKEVVKKKFITHITKYWNENGMVQRDFELKSLSEWVISEYVFVSGFATWFREKEKDNETNLSSLLSNATGEDIEASANIEFDQDRLNLVSEIPTQTLQKLMSITPAGKIAYRSLDMVIMKAMSEVNPNLAKKMENDTVTMKKSWWKFW